MPQQQPPRDRIVQLQQMAGSSAFQQRGWDKPRQQGDAQRHSAPAAPRDEHVRPAQQDR